jgi:hypothetical protein
MLFELHHNFKELLKFKEMNWKIQLVYLNVYIRNWRQ